MRPYRMVPPPKPVGSQLFADMVKRAGHDIRKELESARLVVNQHGVAGGMRESGFRTFLSQLLPESYEISSGMMFDAFDQQSRQLDAMVTSTRPFSGVSVPRIPCESVLAVVEAKYVLNRAEIRDCFEKALSIRGLRPYLTGQFVNARSKGAEAKTGEYRCQFVVVAFSSDLIKSVDWPYAEWKRLKDVAKEMSIPPAVVDRLFILDRGVVDSAHAKGHEDESLEVNAGNWFLHLVNHLEREASRRPKLNLEMYRKRQKWIDLGTRPA